MKSTSEFITENGISMKSEYADSNPNMTDFHGDHWKVIVKANGKRMTLHFSKGYGHNGKEPDVCEVISCLASDASSLEGNDFESWCSDLGYDTDSRKAEKTYKVCERQAAKLRNLLGDVLYDELLYNVEPE